MDNRNIIIGAVLLILTGVTFWIAQFSEEEPTDFVQQSHIPDYYFETVDIVLMNPEGEKSQRLVAKKMTHYPDDDSTELDQPRLFIYDQDAPPWKVRSETGWVSGDGEVLLLNGKVHIDRTAAPGIRGMHMITRDLRVQPSENYAETDNDVHARSHGDIIDSTGMQAWFNQPVRIKLLANVRGHYDAKK